MGVIDNIKRDAQNNRTRIQTSEESKLEGILNKMFYLPKVPDKECEFVRNVMTRGLESQDRVGLHASALIVSEEKFCMRAQVLSLIYQQLQGEQISPGLKRIYEEGNAIHEKWQRLFIRAGYSMPALLDMTQYNEEYMISFTPDIICKIPEFHKHRMIVELKSVNTYSFQKMVKEEKKHPSASKQLQWYMHLSGIHKGFVLSEDKNTQEFKLEVYEYDSKIVAPFIERAEAIMYYYDRVYSEHMMVGRPRNATKPDCKRCADCAMREACWNIGRGRVKIEDDWD